MLSGSIVALDKARPNFIPMVGFCPKEDWVIKKTNIKK
jgi:hypothetical protein